MSCLYILAQFLGAFLGYGLLKLATPASIFVPGICQTLPAKHLNDFQAFLIEFCATTILILVCCGVWDPRSAKNTDSIPLKFGFTVAALSIVAGPYTGCSMNAARTLGPAIWNQDLRKYWVRKNFVGIGHEKFMKDIFLCDICRFIWLHQQLLESSFH